MCSCVCVMAALLDDRMQTRASDSIPFSNTIGSYHSDCFTPTGLRVFYPERVSGVTSGNVSYVRRVLRRDGIVVVADVLTPSEISSSLRSLRADIMRSMHPERFLSESCPHPDSRVNFMALDALNGAPLCAPPCEWVPDGIMEEHRWPLTVSSQIRRLHDGTRNIFSRLYDASASDMRMQPDNARVTFLSHTARGEKRISQGNSPRDAFSRVLNNAFMPPHRLNAFMGYGAEFSRTMENEMLDFGVMGSLIYTDSDVDMSNDNGTSPGFVCAPGVLIDPDKADEKCAAKKYQQLSDDEIEMLRTRWAFVPVNAGDLILWHRNLPHAWKHGDIAYAKRMLKEHHNDPWKLAFAEQRIAWVPLKAHPMYEKISSERAFKTGSKRHRMCELRKRRYHVNGKRRRSPIFKDVPRQLCMPLKAQVDAL